MEEQEYIRSWSMIAYVQALGMSCLWQWQAFIARACVMPLTIHHLRRSGPWLIHLLTVTHHDTYARTRAHTHLYLCLSLLATCPNTLLQTPTPLEDQPTKLKHSMPFQVDTHFTPAGEETAGLTSPFDLGVYRSEYRALEFPPMCPSPSHYDSHPPAPPL